MSTLLSPLLARRMTLANRIVMAPLTRARAGRGHVPNALLAEYYSQRASAGLVITEATMIAADGCAYISEAGLIDDKCVEGWRSVTEAVHRCNGQIIVQLWHPGRATHSVLNSGAQPVSSTDRPILGHTIRTPNGPRSYEPPRRLGLDELPTIVNLFGAAAQRARRAGFDGVEIHGANGYLLDQFLRDSVNDRDDEYGGSIENRARLLLEVLDAAIDVFGADRTAMRLSPLVDFNQIQDSKPLELVRYVAQQADRRRIAFLEIRHADHSAPMEQAVALEVRRNFRGRFFRNGGFDRASAFETIRRGEADAIVFGRPFIANPDLVERLEKDATLAAFNPKTLYTPGPGGYTDYPTLTGRVASEVHGATGSTRRADSSASPARPAD